MKDAATLDRTSHPSCVWIDGEIFHWDDLRRKDKARRGLRFPVNGWCFLTPLQRWRTQHDEMSGWEMLFHFVRFFCWWQMWWLIQFYCGWILNVILWAGMPELPVTI
jgi:hypothetical protein